MGWVEDLRGTTVGLDTAPLIFYMEDQPTYADLLAPFFEAVKSGEIRIVMSTVTLLEVLVHPLKRGDESLAHEYNDILLSSPYIFTVPVTPATEQTAAELRAKNNLKTPDAIHLATAINHRADAFLTGDRDFGQFDLIKILRIRDLVSGPGQVRLGRNAPAAARTTLRRPMQQYLQ
jgi:predicted nucleic acid-binding protein